MSILTGALCIAIGCVGLVWGSVLFLILRRRKRVSEAEEFVRELRRLADIRNK